MAEAGILARSEIRVMIKNSYLQDVSNADVDVVNLTPIEAFENITAKKGLPKSGVLGAFEPRGITVNGAVSGDDASATDRSASYGFISGREKNDPTWNNMEERFLCGSMHPNSFHYIKCSGTTARGIIIHG